MDDDAKKVIEELEKLIEGIPLPENVVKVMRGLIELRTVMEIAEAFNARRDELMLNLAWDIEAMKREFPGKTE